MPRPAAVILFAALLAGCKSNPCTETAPGTDGDIRYFDTSGAPITGSLTVGREDVVRFWLYCRGEQGDVYHDFGPPTLICGCAECTQLSAMPDGQCARILFHLDGVYSSCAARPELCFGWQTPAASRAETICTPVQASIDAGATD